MRSTSLIHCSFRQSSSIRLNLYPSTSHTILLVVFCLHATVSIQCFARVEKNMCVFPPSSSTKKMNIISYKFATASNRLEKFRHQIIDKSHLIYVFHAFIKNETGLYTNLFWVALVLHNMSQHHHHHQRNQFIRRFKMLFAVILVGQQQHEIKQFSIIKIVDMKSEKIMSRANEN